MAAEVYEVTWEAAADFEVTTRQYRRELARNQAKSGRFTVPVCDCCQEYLDNLAAVQAGRCSLCIIKHGEPSA